jgi:outer membrane protein W
MRKGTFIGGMTMKRWKMILLMIISAIFLTSALCWAEFYIGAYLGPNFSADVNPDFQFHAGSGPNRYVYATRTARHVAVDPAAIFGGKIGYWFTKERFLGLKLPNWLKYLGFELDVSYHDMNWPSQSVRVDPLNQKYVIENDAYAISVAFLFMGRYGFLKDSEVPFGRLQPYIGIGPMLFVSSQKLNIGIDFRSTEADLGLAVESGIRYMLLKNVSVNMAFRYRYIPNHLDVDDKIFDQAGRYHYIVMRTNLNLYDIIF